MSIVRQPNGLFAVFSPIVDNFVLVDADRDRLIEYFMEDERDSVVTFVDQRLKLIEEGSDQGAIVGAVTTWERALETIEQAHGAEERRTFEGLEQEKENGEEASRAEEQVDRAGD